MEEIQQPAKKHPARSHHFARVVEETNQGFKLLARAGFLVAPGNQQISQPLQLVCWEAKFPGQRVYDDAEEHQAGCGAGALMFRDGHPQYVADLVEDVHGSLTLRGARGPDDNKVVQCRMYLIPDWSRCQLRALATALKIFGADRRPNGSMRST